MKNTKIPIFYHDKPLFGLDIGNGTIKVMQLEELPETELIKGQKPKVIGYGFATFDKSAQENGVIINPEVIAKAANELFKNNLIGDITTRRVAITLPAYRTFTRLLKIPLLGKAELKEAVELEVEQYISLPLEELYLDYEVVRQDKESMELFVVAVPRSMVNSYVDLADILGLEPVLIEPTVSSSGRLFSIDDNATEPTFIIDFGSLSCDISIYDQHTIITGTVQGGGVNFTEAIKKALDVSEAEAGLIKTRYGLNLSKRQAEIQRALYPALQQISKEIKRMMRYYEERYSSNRPIAQMITLGGGANMPGLSEYLIQDLRMAVRHVDPWHHLDYRHLKPPTKADRPMYATVTGLSLASSRGVLT